MLSGYMAAFVAYLNHGDTREIESYVESAGNLDYLKVYRNGYLKTCVDALSQNYPTLLAVVGNDYFQVLARHYVEEYPPGRHTLVGYGESFPAFVDDTREHHGLVYLSDFARLDHAWLASYFSADESPLTSEQVSQYTTAGHDIAAFTPCLCSHANLVQLRHAVVGVWVELREKKQLTTQ
ncbi:MAG: DNA-binding domain-containing protein, partial [Pseudomonadales bacterium]